MGVEQVKHTLAYIERMRVIQAKMILGGVEFDKETQILSGNDVPLFTSTLEEFRYSAGSFDMANVIYHTAKGFELFTHPEMIKANLAVITNLRHSLEFISSDQPEYNKSRRALDYWDETARRLLDNGTIILDENNK